MFRPRIRTVLWPTLVLTLVLGALTACGRTESAASDPIDVPTATPVVVATTAPSVSPTADVDPQGSVEATTDDAAGSDDAGDSGDSGDSSDSESADVDRGDRESAEPTPTPPAMPTTGPTSGPTAGPTAGATPRPTSTPTPRPTSPPAAPTATARPTPTPTSTPVAVRPTINCSITPTAPVAIGQHLVFKAAASPASAQVDFRFDHGDGTLDPRARAEAYYAAPGLYEVSLHWSSAGHEGAVSCGTVTVVDEHGCYIGVGPADGLGWWCDRGFCPSAAHLDGCPNEAPWGCYTGMDGRRRCVERTGPSPVECLVGPGPADELGWYCNNKWCDPNAPRPECPAYPILGCHPTVDGHTICIDPAPPPVMSCSISKTRIIVGEVTTFTSHQSGNSTPVDIVFNHGDGTHDPRPTSQAYYAAAGTYRVTMDWSWSGGSGTEHCGDVIVSQDL